MKISGNINTLTFGKTPILICQIKSSKNKEKSNATLYKMNPRDDEDRKEIQFSKNTRNIIFDFLKEMKKTTPEKDFYILKDNKTSEVISCAQTSHHYRPNTLANPGLCTLIEEISENDKYINGAEPVIAGIIEEAQNRFDNSVYTAFNDEELPLLKQKMFTKTRNGEFYIPQKRFNSVIDKAEQHSHIEFIV